MSVLKRTAGFLSGAARSVVSTVDGLTGGISIKTNDIPVTSEIIECLDISHIYTWSQLNISSLEESAKIAVARERHGQLLRVSYVVLDKRNKRCFDCNGKLLAHAQLVRAIDSNLEEMLGSHHTMLLMPMQEHSHSH